MKAVQVLLEEALLSELDATEEVNREGRSAVVRRAVAEYLLRQRRQQVREQYRNAYASERDLGPEFAGWEEEGTWPDE
jgi:metal-responsive CopG/Arc/MetJ family transcriptional regulator